MRESGDNYKWDEMKDRATQGENKLIIGEKLHHPLPSMIKLEHNFKI